MKIDDNKRIIDCEVGDTFVLTRYKSIYTILSKEESRDKRNRPTIIMFFLLKDMTLGYQKYDAENDNFLPGIIL